MNKMTGWLRFLSTVFSLIVYSSCEDDNGGANIQIKDKEKTVQDDIVIVSSLDKVVFTFPFLLDNRDMMFQLRTNEYLKDKLSLYCSNHDILWEECQLLYNESFQLLESMSESEVLPSASELTLHTKQYQKDYFTTYNRYPMRFQYVSDRMNGNHTTYKILSFGSSIGLEARTLAEIYFPKSAIFGVDIDASIVRQAIDSTRDIGDRVFIFNGMTINPSIMGPYDVIFANAVLCRHPIPVEYTRENREGDYVKQYFTFHEYNAMISELDSWLNVGGYLVILNSNYRFVDSTVGKSGIYDIPVLLNETESESEIKTMAVDETGTMDKGVDPRSCGTLGTPPQDHIAVPVFDMKGTQLTDDAIKNLACVFQKKK
jgi:hypothetical protein